MGMPSLTETVPFRLPELMFDHDDAQRAAEDWGCNCGPAALAASLGCGLGEVRKAVESVGFAQKRYTNPSMMKAAIRAMGAQVTAEHRAGDGSYHKEFPARGLARIQWTGPWTQPGANVRWMYRQTHWVAAWRIYEDRVSVPLANWHTLLFDINAGQVWLADWAEKVVPRILKECVPRADGGWFITHSWEVGFDRRSKVSA